MGLLFGKLIRVFGMTVTLLCLVLSEICVASTGTPVRSVIAECEAENDGYPSLIHNFLSSLSNNTDFRFLAGSIVIFEADESVNRPPVLDIQIADLSAEKLLLHFSKLIADIIKEDHLIVQKNSELRIVFRNISFSSTDDRYASEKLGGELAIRLNYNSGVWFFEFELELHTGEVYLEPIYLDFKKLPVRLMVTGLWNENERRITMKKFEYIHQDVLRFVGDGSAILGSCIYIEDFKIEAPRFSILKSYDVYILPFLQITELEKSSVAGSLFIAVGWNRVKGWSDIRFELDDISFLDGRGYFEFTGGSGTIDWHEAADGNLSNIKWKQLVLGGIVLGGGSFEGDIHADRIGVKGDVHIAVPSGEILIRNFNMTGLGSTKFSLSLNMVLKSVGMGYVFRDFLWLPSTGTLSADSLDVTYGDGRLVINGNITASLYDGHIKASSLSFTYPFRNFSIVNVDLDGNLSLRALTSELPQFGTMEGRTYIHAHNLVFENMELVSGEFGFRSLEPDTEPHWISTRALENLTFLFGGGNELDHWMFSFFPMWRYDLFGMSFNLNKGLLEQQGIEILGENFLLTDSSLPPTISLAFQNTIVESRVLTSRIALKMTSWLTGMKVDTPEISKLTTQIRSHFDSHLRKGFCNGMLGFTLDGDIALMDKERDLSIVGTEQLEYIEQHNKEIKKLYSAIATAQNQPNWEMGIRMVFTKVWKELAGISWWIETEQGWQRNKANTAIERCFLETSQKRQPVVYGKEVLHG